MKPQRIAAAVLPRYCHYNGRPGTVALVLIAGLLAGCAHMAAEQTTTAPVPAPQPATKAQQRNTLPNLESEQAMGITVPDEPSRKGMASYYGWDFAGQPTASGEPFDPTELTAAHRSLPFGTRVRVTNLKNGKQIVVRINDRGPFVGSRIIDLSRRAAEKLDMIQAGVVPVRLQVLD